MPDAKTILIVDDDRELAEGLRVFLQRQGFKTLMSNNGIEAKQIIHDQKPDLVILDMMMPRMGGYPVLEHLQTQPNPPAIIMITANEGSRHKAYAEKLGVVDYVRKPF